MSENAKQGEALQLAIDIQTAAMDGASNEQLAEKILTYTSSVAAERDALSESYDTEVKIHNKTLDELAAIRRERDALRKSVYDYEEREAAICPEDVGFEKVIGSLRKRLAKVEGALRKYGHHRSNCSWYFQKGKACDCGLVEALADQEGKSRV